MLVQKLSIFSIVGMTPLATVAKHLTCHTEKRNNKIGGKEEGNELGV